MQNKYFNTKQKKQNYKNKFKNIKVNTHNNQSSKSQKIASLISVILLVSSVSAITGYSIYEKYQIEHKPIFELKTEEKSFNISNVEMAFYYNTLTNEFLSTYKSALSYIGLDTSKSLYEQTCYFDDSLSWYEYFEKFSIELMIEKKALAQEADKNGFTYETAEEDYKKFCEEIKEEATKNNMTTNEYLSSIYTKHTTLKNLKPCIIEYNKAKSYLDFLFNEKNITEEDIHNYYKQNKNNYDLVSYRLFEISANVTAEDTEETKVTKMNSAKDIATEFFNQVYDEESFKNLCIKYSTSEEEKKMYEENDTSINVEKKYSEINGAYSEWLFDQSRTEKQTVIIEDKANNKYYILYFIERKQDLTTAVNVRHILITPEISDKTNYLASEDDKKAAYKKAEELLDDWIAHGQTEEYFKQLAIDNSQDIGSNSNGGLYEYVTKGQMGLKEFDAWLFDQNRKPNDYDIIETEYGYHIMYYIEETEPLYKTQIRKQINNERIEKFTSELISKFNIVDIDKNISYLNEDNNIQDTHEHEIQTKDSEASQNAEH